MLKDRNPVQPNRARLNVYNERMYSGRQKTPPLPRTHSKICLQCASGHTANIHTGNWELCFFRVFNSMGHWVHIYSKTGCVRICCRDAVEFVHCGGWILLPHVISDSQSHPLVRLSQVTAQILCWAGSCHKSAVTHFCATLMHRCALTSPHRNRKMGELCCLIRIVCQ